ncbi:hypothetical protein FMM74_007845 [Lachnospiraceae bacterium MD308]|nr:hypothetical protein [Lachnospiraceae bacterium MD308]MCI8580102.1 hypothetical protein [Dorea sp.]
MTNRRKHSKALRIVPFLSLILICGLFFIFDMGQVLAAAKTVKYNGKTIAKYNKSGQMVLVPSKNSNTNYKNLNYLISGHKKKTVVIPKGSTVRLNGVLRPGNNTTIIAKGAKIIGKKKSNVIFAAPDKKLKNLSIIGGTWRSVDKNGRTGSLFAFSYVTNLIMNGVDCNANYKGHAIEIIACNNVTIKNCKVAAIGSNPSKCLEEQIQIDLATRKTAPKIAEYGSKYVNGQTCKNIYILNNTVTGARAVGVNWTDSEGGKWRNKFHQNIVVKGNTLTGTTSEALAYFNTVGGEISNNTIITNATRTDGNSSYTIGIHVAIMGIAPRSMANSTLTVSGNTVYGNRNGIHFKAYFNKNESKCLSQLGYVNVTDNTVYCKKGTKKAIVQVKRSCRKLTLSRNRLYKWN